MSFVLACMMAAVISITTLMQAIYVWIFRWRLERARSDNRTTELDASFPLVAVVLTLRGADPSLFSCLTGLTRQEYRNYQLHIVVDSKDDPALELVDQFFADSAEKPVIHAVTRIRQHCSLKCSAILTAIDHIPASIEIIAFVDADAVVDQNWLIDLVRPMSDPKVGATTGQRWFEPQRPTIGSCLRKAWNAAAIVQMNLYNIAWGGSFAIKRSTIDTCLLRAKWGTVFCEDTMLSTELQRSKLRLQRIETLIVENNETSSMRQTCGWIIRQLLTVRLYHPKWHLVLAHGMATAAASYGAIVALVVYVWLGRYRELGIVLTATVIYQVVNLFLLELIGKTVVATIQSRHGFNCHRNKNRCSGLTVTAGILAQFVQPVACLCAATARTVYWRGIAYDIRAKTIEMREYRPFTKLQRAKNVDESIN